MAPTFTLWLNRLFSSTSDATPPLLQPMDRKPLEIEIERLPDYLWGDLGFQRPRRRGE